MRHIRAASSPNLSKFFDSASGGRLTKSRHDSYRAELSDNRGNYSSSSEADIAGSRSQLRLRRPAQSSADRVQQEAVASKRPVDDTLPAHALNLTVVVVVIIVLVWISAMVFYLK